MSEPIEAGFDTETTGLEYGDHRFVEVYVGLYRGTSLLKALNERIDPQRSISKDAQEIHKISSADLVGKPTWETVAPKVHAFLTKADIIVAHNASFDVDFVTYEFKRVGLVMPKREIIDTMQFSWATPDGKKPSLKELCLACDVNYDPALAHAADYDVDRMMQSLFQARRFGIVPPATMPVQIQHAA
ncbi:3'-5' exonuclease [Pararhizobium qamdonense]|uniref:3'-5' exonuclease n=1 Tax=Pararhizobium qamdonense TaxID=3031126 RepID=UPI0023E18ED7|nr:3'-5' exonuclease [Pararhizobium qamdonense]